MAFGKGLPTCERRWAELFQIILLFYLFIWKRRSAREVGPYYERQVRNRRCEVLPQRAVKTINLWCRANTENVYSGHWLLLVLWHRNEEDPALTRLDVHWKHQWKCCHCSVDCNSSHFWGNIIEICCRFCCRRLLSQIQKFKNVVFIWFKRRDTQV